MGEKRRPFLGFVGERRPFLAVWRQGRGGRGPCAPPPWIRPCLPDYHRRQLSKIVQAIHSSWRLTCIASRNAQQASSVSTWVDPVPPVSQTQYDRHLPFASLQTGSAVLVLKRQPGCASAATWTWGRGGATTSSAGSAGSGGAAVAAAAASPCVPGVSVVCAPVSSGPSSAASSGPSWRRACWRSGAARDSRTPR